MSEYWAGFYTRKKELNFVLRENEFIDFLVVYQKLNNLTGVLEEFDAETIDEYWFVCSDHAGEYTDVDDIPSGHAFCVTEFPTEESDHMLFIPYASNGRRNLHLMGQAPNLDYAEYRMEDEKVYVIHLARNADNPALFASEEPHALYYQLLDGLKRKLDRYLPDNFDWDTHIGCFVSGK